MSEKPQQQQQVLKHLSPQEWEILIDDFQHGGARRHKWTSTYTIPSVVDLAISTVLKRDSSIPLRLHILVFLDEFSDLLFPSPSDDSDKNSSNTNNPLLNLIEALRLVVQSPVVDGGGSLSITYALKEQFMVSVTSILINSTVSDGDGVWKLEGLVELLLAVINRPNHGVDRQTRAVASECLRELERANPCLLSEIAGHLWSLCQSERTHASQSYILLFALVIRNVVVCKLDMSILNTSVSLVPFNVPQWMVGGGMMVGYEKEIPASNLKELRRAMAFLLEWPQVLTPCGTVEFIAAIMPVARALELQASMLKVQFFGMIFSYDLLLSHVVLMMYLNFLDGFNGQESEIVKRLMLMSRETQHYLVFRLLALHWLLGFIRLVSDREGGNWKTIAEMGLKSYPTVFDPLALKSLKLDLLALCSRYIDTAAEDAGEGVVSKDVKSSVVSLVKVFEEGLVSVSAFKWLPSWSTETAVASRTFHKYLIGASSHSDNDPSTTRILMDSKIFHRLRRMLVDLALESQRLVPVIVAFVDRLLGCHKHRWMGERLLQAFDEHLLPKVIIGYRLASYFPIFNRIGENDTVPPRGLLELLTKFMVFLVQNHGPDTGLKSWSQGSKVLGICRSMVMNHHSSRLFLGLSRLLAFVCLYFPDLEVRDNARIYLRMLMCIPGKKLRHMLKLGEQFTGTSPSPLNSSYFNVQSPRAVHDIKKSRNISSYIHLERLIPLLVKQSWSLSLPSLGDGDFRPDSLDGIRDTEGPVEEGEFSGSTNTDPVPETERIDQQQGMLRVMDSRIAAFLQTLRRHFSCIPDFRHMPGLKVKISCSLRFQSEPFNLIWRVDSPPNSLDGIDARPALYATVLTFSSSAPYGSIPSYHVPFLLGESPRKDYGETKSLDIVPVENGFGDEESFRTPVTIELEPREPMPGLVDVSIETNAENGQVIRGQLHNITVGIEDMFLKAIVPSDIPEEGVPSYYYDLFSALWEVCDTSSHTGHEAFQLKGGKGAAAISGTRSVKLLEVPALSLIQATERHLAPFIVSVVGEPLVDIVRSDGIISNIIWKDVAEDSSHDVHTTSFTDFSRGPLRLKYINEVEDEREIQTTSISKRNMGSFFVLIFLPPRFHLLFQMEVSDVSTLVRIRTDHWPCLAYIDDYLEALFLA